MVICGIVGALAVAVAIRPVRKDRPLAPLISTIGLTIVIQNLAVYLIGGQQLAFPETIAQKLYRFGPITISQAQIFILGVALALMVLLWIFIERCDDALQSLKSLEVNSSGVVPQECFVVEQMDGHGATILRTCPEDFRFFS